MPPALFHPTQPFDGADLMHISEFEREQAAAQHAADAEAGTTRLSALNPSLMQDLMRSEPDLGQGLDLLEALAASLRHSRPLRLHLQLAYRVLAISVWPAEREVDLPLSLEHLLSLRLPDLHVLRVEPAPPRDPEGGPRTPLAPLLWELALRGARSELLPEIAGVAAYRIVPGSDFSRLELGGSLGVAVERLRRQAAPLREIAGWPGFDRERAIRMLNGSYLMASLMTSRLHPAAIAAS